MYVFRSFQTGDASGIFSLAKKAWEFTYQDIFSEEKIVNDVNRNYNPKFLPNIIKFIESGHTDFQVALENDEIVGFCQIGFHNHWLPDSKEKDEILLLRLYLDPEYIGKGIASKLLSLAEKWVVEQGFSNYGLEVHKNNKLGVEFYKRKGFIRNSSRDDPEEGHWFMEKTI